MDIDSVGLERALDALGQLLADRQHHHEVVAIGGGSLLLLGQINRPTKDLDLVALVANQELISADPLPLSLLEAAEEVANALNLGKNWLNPGPTSLLGAGLPQGFSTRMHTRHYGGLTIHLAGRLDQICLKLYASADQGPDSKHFADLKSLQPTQSELQIAARWCITQDVSKPFAEELESAVNAFGLNHADS